MTQTSFLNQPVRAASGFLLSGLGKLFHLTLPQVFYLLFLFFLPTQFGKHFFVPFSFVLGIRIDYLAPTIYFTDVVLVLLGFSLCLEKKTRHRLIKPLQRAFFRLTQARRFMLLSLSALLVVAAFTSPSLLLSLYGFVRLSEIAIVAWTTAVLLSSRIIRPSMIVWTLGASVVLQVGIAFFQFHQQSALKGAFYFLGERAFSLSTPGIARAVIDGVVILRPYGTFSHPNVLAGFLLVGSLSLLFFRQFVSGRAKQFVWFAIVTSLLGVVLAMSRSVFIVGAFFLAWLLFYIFQNPKQSSLHVSKHRALFFLFTIGFLAVFSVVLGPLLVSRFAINPFTDEALLDRLVLLQATVAMIADHLFFGVGMNHFIPSLPNYLSTVIVQAKYLQPVHNAFLLILAEMGFIGGIAAVWLFVKAWRTARFMHKKNVIPPSLALVAIVLLSMTDHYFLTSQQGRLLLGFVFGLCFTKIPSRRV